MASKLLQAKLIFQDKNLSGTTRDSLASRCVANWDAIEGWAAKGNAKTVQQAGPGRMALCAWIAAKALADDARIEPFQKSSGISPKEFAALDKTFTAAIQSSRAISSNPSTPRRNAIYRNFEPSSSGSQQSPRSQDQTPEARAKRIRDVMSGAAFANNSNHSSPVSRRSIADDASAPSTPTKRALRDRSSIKEVKIYDPSMHDTTPKKSVVFQPSSTSQISKRPQAALEEVSASPSKQTKMAVKRRHNIMVGYPGGEPLRKGRFEIIGEWDGSRARQRVKQYIAALDRCQDDSGWEAGEVMGHIRLAL